MRADCLKLCFYNLKEIQNYSTMALNLRQKSSFIFNIQVFIFNIMFTI